MIQQIKDAFAEDRFTQAKTALDRLKAMRHSLSPARRAEIDRLDAMFATEQAVALGVDPHSESR